MANKYIHETVGKFARGVKQLLLIGGLALLASCGGDAALKAEQVQTFNKQVIKLDTERHSLLSSLYSTAKRSGGVTPSGKSVTNAELLAQNPAVLKMVGAEKTLAKPQRVQAQTLVSSSFSPVLRIQNGDLPGSYFFTIYESERVAALAANPNWSYEGPAFYTSQTEEGGLSPVWRFRNLINGSYVFTIYESERQSIVNDYGNVFAYEGVSWYARQTEALGFTPLYRFRNVTNGTYLFSAYESEKVAILQNYATTFVYEGVAYYVQVPGGTSATPPPMQVTNQSAVLKPSVISGIDASLTKVDQIGNFTSAAGRTWAKDQVFMYQGRAYRVVGVIVNADGTTSLSTVQPRLDTIYDDLKFTFKANSLVYDANLQPKSVSQIAQAGAGTLHQTQALNSIKAVTPMAAVNGLACLVPKNVEEGKLTTSSIEWGYSWEFNNCSLNDLLMLDANDPLFNIHVNGQMKLSGEMTHEFDKVADTNYTETSQSSEIELTFSGTLTTTQRDLLKAKKDICHDANGVLECEFKHPIGPAATVAIGPVPVTYQIGYGFIFTVDINGQISHKYNSTVVTKKGYKNGVKIDETNKTGGGFKAPVTTLNGSAEIDLFVFGSIDVGIGAEGADLEVYFVKLETKAGGYGSVSAKAELPVCVKYEAGVRIKAEIKILKILDFNLFNFDDQASFPLFLNGAIPLGCDVPGKVHVGYVISGRDYYVKNLTASTDTTDVYDAGKFLISNPSANGKFTIDLSSTRGIIGKETEYSVDIVSGTTSSASMDSFIVSPPNAVAPYIKALINQGNTTYSDVVRFKIAAYDPTNRVATETSRFVEIRIEPAMSASPKYQHYVSTNGAEGYLANYWYGSSGALLTSSQIKNGYLEVAAGDKFVFASEYNNILNNLDTGKDITINTAEDRTNLRPKRLALLSKLDKAGSELFFNFVELTDVVISSVNISPFQPTVGNLATFTVTGDGLPANLAVNIPNCSPPVEVRSAGNIAKNNYSTGIRVFTCTPNASGENLTATFGSYSKLFTIPLQTCPEGQTVVNGVCTTTTVRSVTSITPTTAIIGVPTVFTVTGVNLPLIAELTITDATCLVPINRTTTSFTQTCTIAGSAGAKTAYVIEYITSTLFNTIDFTIRTINAVTASVPVTGLLNDTGITSSQCYQAGSDVLVSCTSPAAIALNSQQDGMVGRDVTSPNNADGKLGFSYSTVGGYPITDCVQDNVTGLMWEGKPTTGMRANTLTYSNYDSTNSPQYYNGSAFVNPTLAQVNAVTNSVGYVNSLNTAMLCGFNDWRIPTVNELHGLVDYGRGDPIFANNLLIDTNWLPNTVNTWYWTSNRYVGSSYNAWAVSFYEGQVDGTVPYGYVGGNGYRPDGSYRLRLVRGSSVQSSFTYLTIPYGVDASNNAVLDSRTGLQWRRCSEGQTWNGNICLGSNTVYTHEQVLVMATQKIGWRLPNVKELASITDKTKVSPAVDNIVFPATSNSNYWASSISASVWGSGYASAVLFSTGEVNWSSRGNSYSARLVR